MNSSVTHLLRTTWSRLSLPQCVCAVINLSSSLARVAAYLRAGNYAALVQWHSMFWSVGLHTPKTLRSCICYFITASVCIQ